MSSFESIVTQQQKRSFDALATPQKPSFTGEKNLITLAPSILKGTANVIQKGVGAAEKAIEFTGLPWLAEKAGGLMGKGVESILEKKFGEPTRSLISKYKETPIIKKAAETAKVVRPSLPSTSEFYGQTLRGGVTAAPFAGLGRIPSATIMAPTFYEGVKEKDPTKIAIGGLGVLGAKYSKGKWLEPEVTAGLKSGAKQIATKLKLPTKPPTSILEKATGEMRTILRPTQGEIKNLEIRQGKDVNDFYKLAVEEQLPIKQSPDKKLDTLEAIEKLRPKQTQIHEMMNTQLKADSVKQFDLLDLAEKAKVENAKEIKNATDLKSANKDVNEYIADEIERSGRFITGEQLNNFKSGMWGSGYNIMKPTAQATARKLGRLAKELIEDTYSDTTIKQLNELGSKFATLSHLLANANGRVIQGGAIGRYTAQILGAVAGSKVPIVGSIAGQWAGGKVADALYNPVRRSIKVARQAEQAGVVGKSFKQATESAMKSMVERQPKYPLLPPSKGSTLDIQLPERTARLSAEESGIISPALPPTSEQITASQKAAGIYRPPQKLYGAMAGIEPQYDESGKIVGIKYSPTKGAMGMLGMAGIAKAKGLGKNAESLLPKEAKKYKSAEEFVKAQQKVLQKEASQPTLDPFTGEAKKLTEDGFLYHGTNKSSLDGIINTGLKERTFFYNNLKSTKNLSNNTKRFGEDGVILRTPMNIRNFERAGENILVWQADKGVISKRLEVSFDKGKTWELLTKSQLTDIWNKANQATPKASLLQEAKKYKSAEEFVKAQTKSNSWSEAQKTSPDLWNKGILRKDIEPYGAKGVIPKEVHSAQGKWQNYGEFDEISADKVYKRIDSGSFKGEYEDKFGNAIRDNNGNVLQDVYDDATGEWIKPMVSNKELRNQLLDTFTTKEGKQYLNEVINALPKNPDGTITAYRIGKIGGGEVQSYTLSEGMAKTFSNQGTSVLPAGTPGLPTTGYKDFGALPTNMVKIDPNGIKAWSPYDAEILVEPKYVQTKSQLTDIWNRAQEKIVRTPPPSIPPYKETGNLTTKILKDLVGKTKD